MPRAVLSCCDEPTPQGSRVLRVCVAPPTRPILTLGPAEPDFLQGDVERGRSSHDHFQVVAPPTYLTGYLEFQDTLGKNLSEAYVGQLPAKDVLKKTQDEWSAVVRRIGRSKLKDELASYKAVMPRRNLPA